MKKTINKIILFAMVLSVLGSSLTVSAAVRPSVQPNYDNAQNCTALLSISNNGLATCYGKIILSGAVSTEITATLYKSSNKVGWTSVKSWSRCGTLVQKIDQNYYVLSGYYYRLEVKADIYNSKNELIEEITTYSVVCSY